MFDNYNKVQQAVLQTTLRIINQKELQATSMALIAKESGVSTGSIYHYFQSKEEIINELYRAIVGFNGDYVKKGLESEGSIRVRFNLGWRYVVELSKTYPQGFQFLEQYSFSPYIRDSVKKEAYTGGWCEPMNKLYAEAVERKLFTAMDPKLMVQMHYGSMVYMVKAHLQGQLNLTDAIAQEAISACWNSVSESNRIAG